MIDTSAEQLLTLCDASKTLPSVNGRRVHTSTLWRWCRKGVRGIHLDYLRMGNRVLTSRQALERFGAKLAELDSAEIESPTRQSLSLLAETRTSGEKGRAIAEAEKELDKAGI